MESISKQVVNEKGLKPTGKFSFQEETKNNEEQVRPPPSSLQEQLNDYFRKKQRGDSNSAEGTGKQKTPMLPGTPSTTSALQKEKGQESEDRGRRPLPIIDLKPDKETPPALPPKPKGPTATQERSIKKQAVSEPQTDQALKSPTKAKLQEKRKSIKDFTIDDVKESFESDPEVRAHAKTLFENEIDGQTLLELDDKMLKEDLGITALGARMKIKKKISSLRYGTESQERASGTISPKPAPVQNFTVEDVDHQSVTVKWDPQGEATDGYKLEVMKTQEPDVIVQTQNLSQEKTSATCSSLEEGTSYTIKLTALSGGTASEPVKKTLITRTSSPLSEHEQRRSEDTYIEIEDDTVFKETWSARPDLVMSPEERQLQQALNDVLKTETLYRDSMSVLVNHFMKDAKLKSSMKSSDYKVLLSNAADVLKVSELFIDELQRRKEDSEVIDICDIIANHANESFLDPYKNYCMKLPHQKRILQSLTKGILAQEPNEKFREALKALEKNGKCEEEYMKLPPQKKTLQSLVQEMQDHKATEQKEEIGVKFSMYLLLPYLRIKTLPSLVNRILTLREKGTMYFSTAVEATAAARSVSKQCILAIAEGEQMIEFEDLVKKLHFDKVDPNFSLLKQLVVRQGELTWVPEKGKKTKMHIVLLTDYLLVTKKIEDRRMGSVFSLANYCQRDQIYFREIDRCCDDLSIAGHGEEQSIAGLSDELSIMRRGQQSLMSFFRSKPVDKVYKFSLTLLEDCDGKEEEMIFETRSPNELTRWVDAFQNRTSGKVYQKENCPIVTVRASRSPNKSDELSLEEGDTVYVLRKTQDGWWHGETTSDERQGWFPSWVTAKGGGLGVALQDCKEADDSQLRIKKGQRLQILSESEGWYWTQSVDTAEVGYVHSSYVKLLGDQQAQEGTAM